MKTLQKPKPENKKDRKNQDFAHFPLFLGIERANFVLGIKLGITRQSAFLLGITWQLASVPGNCVQNVLGTKHNQIGTQLFLKWKTHKQTTNDTQAHTHTIKRK